MDTRKFSIAYDVDTTELCKLLEELENRIDSKQEQFFKQLQNFKMFLDEELEIVQQRELEMTAGEHLSASGRDTALYHDFLRLATFQASELLKSVKEYLKYKADSL